MLQENRKSTAVLKRQRLQMIERLVCERSRQQARKDVASSTARTQANASIICVFITSVNKKQVCVSTKSDGRNPRMAARRLRVFPPAQQPRRAHSPVTPSPPAS
jgi:hypothetical protein